MGYFGNKKKIQELTLNILDNTDSFITSLKAAVEKFNKDLAELSPEAREALDNKFNSEVAESILNTEYFTKLAERYEAERKDKADETN